MDELGYLSDPGDKLGMLDAQLLRAARVVVDIGVHLELAVPADSRWRPGEIRNAGLAWEFLRTRVQVDKQSGSGCRHARTRAAGRAPASA